MNRSYLLQKIALYAALYAVTAGIILSLFLVAPYERNDFPLFRDFIILFASILLTKYFIYMTVSPWYDVVIARLRARRRAAGTAPYRPKVSVIIPAWNEEVGLVATVETVLASSYGNMEVIVVNDGSVDGSDAKMRAFLAAYDAVPAAERGKIPVVYKYKENGGKGRALNHGIMLSTGDIIVSIDADCALLPDTVGNFVRYFEDPRVMAAVGNVKIGNTKHVLGTLQYLEFLFSFYFKKADALFNTIYIIGGAAGAFRREVFHQVGLYNPANITEDIDLSVRIQEAGMKIAYAADAVVYTEGASTIEGLSKQRLRWKQGRFQTFSEHRKIFFSTSPRHNKFLSWLVLPLAVFGDTQLFFEIIFLVFLYVYSAVTHDFSSFISGIFVVSSMFFVQIMNDRSAKKSLMYLLAPIGWLLFYITTAVDLGHGHKEGAGLAEMAAPWMP
jgi:biofilm PGA synthesis N-glycosyltransferase PgaC